MKCPYCNRDETKPTQHTEFPPYDPSSGTNAPPIQPRSVTKGPCGPLKTLVVNLEVSELNVPPERIAQKVQVCANCLQKIEVEMKQAVGSLASLIPSPSDED